MDKRIHSYKELRVYKNAFAAAMEIYKKTKSFPAEEKYSLVDQMRRSSRSVCANLAEAWRKRRYQAAFISKLSEVAGEANETQVWLEMATECGYMTREEAVRLDAIYNHILAQLTVMSEQSHQWILV